MANYQPKSCFFVDYNNLSNSVTGNLATDAFGPISGNLTTKYRTTSFVRATALTKVFAICSGQILIQPHAGDNTKVNLILKPSASAIYGPIKIKYFIYRGVNKSDLIDNNSNFKAVNTSDPNQPTFLGNLWKDFVNFNQPFYDQGIIATPLDTFPALLVGYNDGMSDNTLIEYYFNRNNAINSNFFEIPTCKKGDFLGNFTGRIGLDVVLDYGDYKLTNQDELFKLDLNFARKSEHIFDVSTITPSTATKIKRYKEHIHQFLDAAAFWGSHIDCGEIKSGTSSTVMKTSATIFSSILNKYQTKNKLYFYIQTERERTYNYYNDTRKVHGIDTSGISNDTNEWPIIIKEKTFSSSNSSLKIGLEYTIDPIIHESNRSVSISLLVSNNNLSIYPKVERPDFILGYVNKVFNYDISKLYSNSTITHYSIFPTNTTLPTGVTFNVTTGVISGTPTAFYAKKTLEFRAHTPAGYIPREITLSINPVIETASIKFSHNGTKSCANFIFIYGDINQELSYVNYFNNLWPVNLDSNFKLSNDINLAHWVNYDKNQIRNFDDVLNLSANVQHKIIFDNGTNDNLTPATKRRRLYISSIKKNSKNYKDLNVNTSVAGLSNKFMDASHYSKELYNDDSFVIYKGTFQDGNITVNSLALDHENNFVKKFSFQNLGILEEEFNKLVYNNINIPPVISPNVTPSQILPNDADKVFYYLDEQDTNQLDIRKFKLGLQYEDASGVISAPLYPSSSNEVFVYTVDGYFFFSKGFSDYHQYHDSFSGDVRIDFRPKTVSTFIEKNTNGLITQEPRLNWLGKFGFDWNRRFDTEMSNENTDSSYNKNTGKYFSENNLDYEISPDETYSSTNFIQLKREWLKSLNISHMYPIKNFSDSIYSSSWLSIYPSKNKKNVNLPFPKQTLSGESKCLTDADIELKVQILNQPDSLKITFEKDYFQITATQTNEITILPDTIDNKTGIIYKNIEVINKSVTGINLRTLDIKIKCLKEYSVYKKIKVIATKGQKEYLSGLLNVMPNEKQLRKQVDVVFVNVKTNVPNRPSWSMGPGVRLGMDYSTNHSKEVEDKITSFFNQALIDIRFLSKVTLDATPGAISPYNPNYSSSLNQYIGYGGISGELVVSNNLISVLNSHFLNYNPQNNMYRKSFIVFFVNEGLGSGRYGVSEGIDTVSSKVVIYSDGFHDTTPAHELLHTTGLFHTFNNRGVFTRNENTTDNIMDYSDMASLPDPINVVALWKGQWEIIKKHTLVKPENL